MYRILLSLLPCLLVLGCGTSAPSYYTLSAKGVIPKGNGIGIGVGVGPVILAEYLNRQNLVVKTSENHIEVSENHHWAGDLNHSISRVISRNLGRELQTGNVYTYPWTRDSDMNYQVSIDIREFVAGHDGHAHLDATWRVFALPGRRMVVSKNFLESEPIATGTFEAMVAAQSELLARLSDDIATEIRKHQ